MLKIVVLCFSLFLLSITAFVSAQSDPTPPPPVPIAPTVTAAAPTASVPQHWTTNNVVRVRTSVPFVWLRDAFSSSGVQVGTVLSGGRLVVLSGVPQNGPDGDGRWWWQVRDPNSVAVGWVEQESLEYVRSRPNFRVSPLPPSAWRQGFAMRVKRSLPFAWIRSAPSSEGGVVFTLRPGDAVVLNLDSSFDGVQNWRAVQIGNAPVAGWVEESSLEFDRIWTRF